MPAYSFHARFVAMIEDGRKRQTIRRRRRRRTRPGATLHLYLGMRTKLCRKIGMAVCTMVVPIEIHKDGIYGPPGDGREKWSKARTEELARADGFADAKEMLAFFARTYDLPRRDMEIVYWAGFEPVTGKRKERRMGVKLGEKVKDKISGFRGTVISRTEYYNGCWRIGVRASKLGSDGKPVEEFFDEQDLCSTSKAKVGGPHAAPRAISTPPRR